MDLKTATVIKSELIAPCGMNCAVCMARLLREKNVCPGCRGDDTNKPVHCSKCVILNCDHLKKSGLKYCSIKCKNYPCTRLKNLDKRYRTKYRMSMLENLSTIERLGIRSFVKNERARWTCSQCGGIICVHRSACIHCGKQIESD